MKEKKAESQRSHLFAHFTIERAADAIFWVDSEARIHYVNEAACRSLGYSLEELLSMNVHDIDPDFQGDKWLVQWEKVRELKSFTHKSHHRAKDGRIFPVEISTNYIEFEGREYSCAFVRDITERIKTERDIRESEQRFKDIFRAVNDGIFIVDPEESRIVDVNDRAVEMLGYEREEMIGMKVEKIHPKEMDEIKKTLMEVIRGNPVVTDEFSCLRKDNHPLPADMSFSRVELNGKTFIMAMVRDITERKLSEKKLRNALARIEELKNQLEAENIYLQEEIKVHHNFEEIISQGNALKKVLQKVEQVASTDASVLVLGETGTGKELLARAVHNISDRNERPLVKVNCAAIPVNLVESELFGHEKGAFTGALSRKIGRFELANRGTIFLDEIGDLSLDLQSKLLRVLQEGEFERLGNPHVIKVDVRVIAATHRNLEKAIEDGEFREDLYYRLNVFPIEIPPLRERKDDIPLLVKHFVNKYSGKTGKKINVIPQKIIDALVAYNWPGNIRELENIVERAVIISRGNQLELGDWLARKQHTLSASHAVSLEDVERAHINEVLEMTGWRVSGENGAAKILGLKPTTLEARMNKLGIKRKK
ncbi:MAG: sigma 54-interacting transcriptional regulator [Nitrospirota bacterium]